MAITYSSSNRSTFAQSWFGSEPKFAIAGIVIALSLLATLPAMLLDTRTFQGDSVWVKPIKFQAALTVYLLSLAFFARFLPNGMTERPTYKIFSALVVFGIFAELIWIGGAAMYGTASHFNVASPFMAAVYSLMGVFAVMLTSASLVFGVAMLRNPPDGLNRALGLAIALSLILTFVLTIIVAGTLGSQTGHLVGTPEIGAKMPLMGWSREVGDLRVAHFLATHAMHFVPVIGLVAVMVSSGPLANVFVWIGSACYTLLVVFTFVQALSGQPFIGL